LIIKLAMWKLIPPQKHALLALLASISIAEINVKYSLTNI